MTALPREKVCFPTSCEYMLNGDQSKSSIVGSMRSPVLCVHEPKTSVPRSLDQMFVLCTTRSVLVKWSGQGPFCLVLQPVLIAAQKDQQPDDENHRQDDQDDAEWAC